jgi:hypothetical protein
VKETWYQVFFQFSVAAAASINSVDFEDRAPHTDNAIPRYKARTGRNCIYIHLAVSTGAPKLLHNTVM